MHAMRRKPQTGKSHKKNDKKTTHSCGKVGMHFAL